MSRYIERAENVARFVDVHQSISLGGIQQWASLIYASGDQELFQQHYDSFSPENVLRFLLFDERNPNSILACTRQARENARSIREVLSVPMWEAINRFYLRVRAGAQNTTTVVQNPHTFLERVKRSSHQLIGVTEATLSQGEAWHFARVGRMLERADKTSRILDVKYYILLPSTLPVGSTLDVVQWSALLESTSALHAYRKEFGRIEPSSVANFLILNRTFPRSLRFCIEQAEISLHEIIGTPVSDLTSPVTEQFAGLCEQLRETTIDNIFREGLHEFIDVIQARINELGAAMFQAFFEKQTYGDRAGAAVQ